MKLKSVKASKVLNSRRQPTIEIVVNSKYSATAPSGASTGEHEVLAYPKEGLDYVINFINSFKGFKGIRVDSFEDLEKVEQFSSIIKGNPMIALEFAILKALSDNKVWKFLNPNADNIPMPLGNVIGGGAHVKLPKKADIQEFLLLPKTEHVKDAVFANSYIHKVIGQKLGIKKKTDEGAWAPQLDTLTILDLIKETVEKVGSELGFKIGIGLDMAASGLWGGKKYKYQNFSKKTQKISLTSGEQIEFVKLLVKRYGLVYVEDPIEENDFEGFKRLKDDTDMMICGDDLTCTNLERLKRAKDCINAIIIKPNQIGSVLKTKEVVEEALKNNITPVISHRSGETMDATISHLAIAWDIPIIKCGIFGKERQIKLKELMKIEKESK